MYCRLLTFPISCLRLRCPPPHAISPTGRRRWRLPPLKPLFLYIRFSATPGRGSSPDSSWISSSIFFPWIYSSISFISLKFFYWVLFSNYLLNTPFLHYFISNSLYFFLTPGLNCNFGWLGVSLIPRPKAPKKLAPVTSSKDRSIVLKVSTLPWSRGGGLTHTAS